MNVGRAWVSIAPDTSKFRGQLVRELKPLIAQAEREIGTVNVSAKVKVETDSRGVQGEVRREVAQAERKGPIKLKMEVDKKGLALATGGLLTAFSVRDLSQFVAGAHAVAAAVQPAAAALTALGAAAYGAISALAPLAGLLPTLAVGISSLGQGAGVVAAAFSGIGGALKAYKQTQDAATTSTVTGERAAKAAARAQVAAARQLRDAIENVDDARRVSAEALEAAAERVDDAERDLTRSQEAARRAQDDLNEARREAKEELEDLQLAVERSALGEQRAHLRVEEARVRLRRVRVLDATSGGRASRQLRDATLDVAEAELSVREAAERRGDEQERLNKLTTNGIDGSERVVDAQDRIRNANEQVLDSRRALISAEKAVITTQVQGARRISNALEQVERAHESVADAAERVEDATAGATAGVDKFANAMDNLSPAAQSFVEKLLSFEAPLKRLRDVAAENLFPGLERGLEAMRPLFGVFEPIVAATARTLGNLGERFGKMLGGPFFQRAFTTLGEANVRILESLGNAAIALAPALTQILVAATPLAEAFARLTEKGSKAFAAFIDGEEKSGGLARFFETTEKAVRLLWNVLEPFIRILFGVGKAASSTGEFVLKGIGGALDELATKVNSPEGQAGLKTFFESLWPAITEIGRLIVDVAKAFAQFAKDGAPKLAPLIKQVREELLPALIDLANKASEHGPKIIDFITRIAQLLTALPVDAVINVLSRFFDIIITISESRFGDFFFDLASSLSVVKLAVWALTPILAALGITISPLMILIAGLALVIIANWDTVEINLLRVIRFLVGKFLWFAEMLTKTARAAFGWIPWMKDDVNNAADAVEELRDRTNAALTSMIDEKTITIRMRRVWDQLEQSGAVGDRYAEGAAKRASQGFYGPAYHRGMELGPVKGPRGTDVPILARAGEWVVTERQMAKLTGGDGASAPVTNHTWNITAIPVGDLPTEIPRRIRSAQHLWG